MHPTRTKIICALGMSSMIMASSPLIASPVHLYGLNAKNQQLMSHKKNTLYTVHLAAFKNKHNAENYRQSIQNKIHEAVHLSHPTGSEKVYNVYLGPINTSQLNEVRQKLLKKHAPTQQTKESKQTMSSSVEVDSPSTSKIQMYAERLAFLKPQVVMISGGVGWATPGKTQTIFLSPDGNNAYNDQSNTQALGLGEIFLGIERPIKEHIQSQWGVLVGAAGMSKTKGVIWQFADPQFDNLSYSYNLSQVRFGLRTKWILDHTSFTKTFKPYITGSVGVGLNKSFSFNNTINIASAVPNPNFQNQTMAAFSYSAGIGVQKDITPHLQAGLGYEMLDFGQSGLGRAPEQTINSGINMDHLYMHTLLLSLTHRA